MIFILQKRLIIVLFCICLFFLLAPKICVYGFEIAWEVDLPGWAQMPIIKDGVVYAPFDGGTLSAVDLQTGQVLKTISGVADSTAPFIVGNKIYVYDDDMHEIDLDSFQRLRTIQIPDASYTENIPYDNESGCFYAMQAQASQYKGRLSAFRLSDGQIVWSFPAAYTGGFDGHQAPIVVGDSVFLFAENAYWQDQGVVFRLDKKTGKEIWSTRLSSSSRGGYNNPIYDEDHDLLYFSESWNSGSSKVWALKRDSGEVVWSREIPFGNIESTLSYHDSVIYVPVHNFARSDGWYLALDSSNGNTVWQRDGFFHEDGWSATAVCDRYLYRVTHGTGNKIIVQDRLTGDLVWSVDVGSIACCANPVQSEGVVVFGSENYLWGLKVGSGQKVDSSFHGRYQTGYNPGAIEWGNVSPTTTITLAPTATPIYLRSDINRDGVIDLIDAIAVFSSWASRGSSQYQYREDTNDDGKVNGSDIGLVFRNWSR